MMEAPDPKAEFAVNLPRTGALRNRMEMGIVTAMPGKICYEHVSTVKRHLPPRPSAE
jgi:hypothetical protein